MMVTDIGDEKRLYVTTFRHQSSSPSFVTFSRKGSMDFGLTQEQRSWQMKAREFALEVQGVNAVLVMNYSTIIIQRVTELNLAIHVGSGPPYTYMDALPEKLVRDGIIWT